MKRNENFLIRKIPLYELIESLQQAYLDGADFVDLSGRINDTQDDLLILVREEYLHEEQKPLSDDDLNQLIP